MTDKIAIAEACARTGEGVEFRGDLVKITESHTDHDSEYFVTSELAADLARCPIDKWIDELDYYSIWDIANCGSVDEERWNEEPMA